MKTNGLAARIFAVILAGLMVFSFASCGQKKDKISEVLDSYDSYIGKMEQALKKQDIASLSNLMASAVEVAAKLSELQGTEEWKPQHTKRLAELTARYATAAANAAGDVGNFDLSSLGL